MAVTLYELQGADDRRFSPYCWRIRMALAHKGIVPETVPVRFTEKDKIAFSGQPRVPVVVDNGKTIVDSWDIAGHLEDTYPDRPTLFPGGRASARFFQEWANANLGPNISPLIILDIWKHLDPEDQVYFRESRETRLGRPLEEVSAGREERRQSLYDALAPVRGALEESPFLAGDQPAYVDYIVFGGFQWARCVSDFPLLDPGDPVHAWRRRMLESHDGLAGRAVGYPC